MSETQVQSRPSEPHVIEARDRALSDLDVGEVRSAIESHGAVLLRGFRADVDAFGSLGQSLCSSASYNESPNRDVLKGGGAVQSVNLGADPFPLHPELSREPWRPDLAMFACLEAPDIGGQTNICDGIAIARELPVDLRHRLESAKLFYIQPASPQMLRYWLGTETPDDALLANPPESCPYWFRRAQGRIVRGFIRPALEPTTFQSEPAWVNFALFARDYLQIPNFPLLDGKPFPDEMLDTIRSVARRLTHSHVWEAGDIVLLDNSRFMHGRKAIANADTRRIATYFGYLDGVTRPGVEPENPVWRRETFVPPDNPHDT